MNTLSIPSRASTRKSRPAHRLFLRRALAVALGACLGWSLLTSPSAALSPTATALLDEARQMCRAYQNGTFNAPDSAISLIDLTGDGQPEEILDSSRFDCSTGHLYCGSGGCWINVVVDGAKNEFLTRGWQVITWGDRPILLLSLHGSACDGPGFWPCFEALVWVDGAFRSVGHQ